jgi:carboxypeptidase Q
LPLLPPPPNTHRSCARHPATAPDAVPSIVLASEQYNMLVRMAKAGEPLKLRTEIAVRVNQSRLDSDNILAEIPGTDALLKDEVVLVGADLDSWHTAVGATDNADAVSAAMEAIRILSALHASPRRTIRIVLGEARNRACLARAPGWHSNLPPRPPAIASLST